MYHKIHVPFEGFIIYDEHQIPEIKSKMNKCCVRSQKTAEKFCTKVAHCFSLSSQKNDTSCPLVRPNREWKAKRKVKESLKGHIDKKMPDKLIIADASSSRIETSFPLWRRRAKWRCVREDRGGTWEQVAPAFEPNEKNPGKK